jgi:hypothetical protein
LLSLRFLQQIQLHSTKLEYFQDLQTPLLMS